LATFGRLSSIIEPVKPIIPSIQIKLRLYIGEFQTRTQYGAKRPMPFANAPSAVSIPASLEGRLSLPVIAAPLFIISNPDLTIAQCKAGVHGNYLRPSVARSGLDPDNLPTSDPSAMDFAERRAGSNARPWRDIWGSGQRIGAVNAVVPASELIARLRAEYAEASARIIQMITPWATRWFGGAAATG
jgi:NAD(P)H-dependent flavin oxidoreductase YrpB (nitropropane dioxygenase family)